MRYAVLLAAVLALLVPAAMLAAPSGAAQTEEAQTAFDSTVTIDVFVETSGDARINVSTAYPVNSTAEREAFDRVAEEFRAGRIGFHERDFEAFAARASEETGRTMEITEVERVAEVRGEGGNATGLLALELTWTNFANVSGPRVVLDDVYRTGWLGHLEPDMRLRISSDYRLHDAPVPLRDGRLVWEGPHTFEGGGPTVVFERSLNTPTTSPTQTTATPPGGDGFEGEFQLVLAIVAILLVGGFLAYVWNRRDEPDQTLAGAGLESAASEDGSSDGGSIDEAGGATDGDADGPDDEEGDGVDATGGGSDGKRPDADEEPEVDEELLSDEERVERMLERSGGRMKQANIVKETGWSNAKVSQLLSGMDEEGTIEKLRLGRENLIMLADEEVGDWTDPGE